MKIINNRCVCVCQCFCVTINTSVGVNVCESECECDCEHEECDERRCLSRCDDHARSKHDAVLVVVDMWNTKHTSTQ